MKVRKLVFHLFFISLGLLSVGASNRDLWVEPTLSKQSAYPNEEVLLKYTLYTRLDMRYEGFETEPVLPFQWIEDSPAKPESVKTEKVEIDNLRYVAAKVRKIQLFPMKSGDYKLETGQVNTSYSEDRWQKDRTKKLIECPLLMLYVKDFPETGRPVDFNGFSGEFDFESDHLKVMTEARKEFVLLTLSVRGEGNIRQFPLPALDLPQGLKIEKVEEKTELDSASENLEGPRWEGVEWQDAKLAGVKEFKVYLSVEKAGDFIIPAAHFSYFDPKSERYVSIKGKEHVFPITNPRQSSVPLINETTLVSIVLDVSGSMLALDFKPVDRISVAKSSLAQLLDHEKMKNNLTSLKVFDKYVREVWPAEKNNPAHNDLLRLIETAVEGSDGTATGSAIYEAVKSAESVEGNGKKVILLLTDGDRNAGHLDTLTAAHFALEQKVPIYSILIGKGGKVPFQIKDKDFGNREVEVEVKVYLKPIKEISELTGGKYFEVKSESDFKAAVEEFAKII